MTKTIFRNVFLMGLVILLVCGALFLLTLHTGVRLESMQALQAEALRIRDAMALTDPDAAIRAIDSGERITWIGPDGAVLFDNRLGGRPLENHLTRPEVQEALAAGTGEDSRRSVSAAIPMDYWALRMPDGSVLRLSERQMSLGTILRMMLRSFILMTLAMLALCAGMSLRLARRIVAPINAIDPDDPDERRVYPELHPLITRLQEQNRDIRAHLSALSARQSELDAVTETMHEGFLLVGPGGAVLSGNRSARRLTGLAEGAEQTLDAPGCPAQIRTLAETALGGARGECVLPLCGGTWQVTANPVPDAQGVRGAVLLMTDVTDREEREALRREFSANVSHELKTPLTSICGFAELMKEGLVPQETMREFSGDIYRESRRMIDLIDDILALSRLDEGAGDFPFADVDLYELCGEVIETLRPAAQAQHVTLEQAGQHAVIRGVPQLLREMVFNLCDNAVKYNVPEGRVTVSVWQVGGSCTLSVADTGIGIPYEHQQRVFERFYRVDKSHSRAVGGTGLGLSIVKHAAQIHGARIVLNSTPGKGTAIAVTFRTQPPA